MGYVPIPKDLKKVKTKVAFNLTRRQLTLIFKGSNRKKQKQFLR